MRIRFKANSGIYGLPLSEDSPNGEYPEGYEIDVDEVPEGWLTKVDVISGKPSNDAKAITNPTSKEPDSEEAKREEASERGTESKDQADTPRRGRPRNDA